MSFVRADESQLQLPTSKELNNMSNVSPTRPDSLPSIPKKSVILSLDSPFYGVDRSDIGYQGPPIRAKVVYFVTLMIFSTSIMSLGATVAGIVIAVSYYRSDIKCGEFLFSHDIHAKVS